MPARMPCVLYHSTFLVLLFLFVLRGLASIPTSWGVFYSLPGESVSRISSAVVGIPVGPIPGVVLPCGFLYPCIFPFSAILWCCTASTSSLAWLSASDSIMPSIFVCCPSVGLSASVYIHFVRSSAEARRAECLPLSIPISVAEFYILTLRLAVC